MSQNTIRTVCPCHILAARLWQINPAPTTLQISLKRSLPAATTAHAFLCSFQKKKHKSERAALPLSQLPSPPGPGGQEAVHGREPGLLLVAGTTRGDDRIFGGHQPYDIPTSVAGPDKKANNWLFTTKVDIPKRRLLFRNSMKVNK